MRRSSETRLKVERKSGVQNLKRSTGHEGKPVHVQSYGQRNRVFNRVLAEAEAKEPRIGTGHRTGDIGSGNRDIGSEGPKTF